MRDYQGVCLWTYLGADIDLVNTAQLMRHQTICSNLIAGFNNILVITFILRVTLKYILMISRRVQIIMHGFIKL